MPDSRPEPSEQGIGAPVRRLEDAALLTGHGRFIDDIALPGQAHAHFVRCPHAHARILGIDAADALAAPGVIAVYTGADMKADNVGEIRAAAPVRNRDGSALDFPSRHCFATETARYIGDAVAVVIAETAMQAADAAEYLAVDYDILPSVTGTLAADKPGAPVIWPQYGSNVALDWARGDK
ncbi:MAG: xanthine dehydrogenase family protein molybdopterin-binding subunit, partial [Proteobacteria bacterium]|nr:xanthine dehydrogenase family protein molybdopterin-binding subunit [Pseudomonadota bacterium]